MMEVRLCVQRVTNFCPCVISNSIDRAISSCILLIACLLWRVTVRV